MYCRRENTSLFKGDAKPCIIYYEVMIPIYLFSRLKVVNIEEREGVIVYMLNQT